MSPQARREAVGILMAERQMGVTRACGLVGISRSLLAYRPRRREPAGLRERIGEIALAKRRYGYRRVHVLLRREGWQINHKRTHRLYREAGLQVLKRSRKRIGMARPDRFEGIAAIRAGQETEGEQQRERAAASHQQIDISGADVLLRAVVR